MGGGSWKDVDYVKHATNTGLLDAGKTKGLSHGAVYKSLLSDADTVIAKKSAKEVFTQNKVNQALNPKGVKARESRDSVEHPQSNAVIVALDVTGSMNFVAKAIAQVGLPKLMTSIYDRKPVADPQIMFMGFDDIEGWVGGHLQVSQFESDIRIAEQLSLIWLENNGGGNDYESYSLSWYFAANHTSIDCWEKRKKKGYLFTIGDELPTPKLNKEDVERVLGYPPQANLSSAELLKEARRHYNVFHIIAEEGNYARGHKSETREAWANLMGEEFVITLPDHTKLAEVVVSTIQIAEGADPTDVAKSWEDKKAATVVATAVKNVKRIITL